MNKFSNLAASIAGTMLAVSAIGKYSDLSLFAVLLSKIFNLPITISTIASVLISSIELSAGLTLIVEPSGIFSKLTGVFMYACFSLTQIYIILSRGGDTVECGCFGAFQGTFIYKITASHWIMLVIDTFFAGALWVGIHQFIINSALAEKKRS
jgi:hypothetical protein